MQSAVDFVARCIASKASQQIGNITIKQLTQEEYDALDPKDPNTLYFVYNNGSVSQYIGTSKLNSAVIQNASFQRSGFQGVIASIDLQGVE